MTSEQLGATPARPVAIAPAPSHGVAVSAPPTTMPYTCLSCARRKIRCDKEAPTCSACRKGKLDCRYQAPQPRQRKRKPSGDVHEKLAQYERILRENNLLPAEDDPSLANKKPSEPEFGFHLLEAETMRRLGKLVIDDEGKTRYVDSHFWRSMGDDELPVLADEADDKLDSGSAAILSLDPLTAAFMGSTLDLSEYHPTLQEAQLLWKAHMENVEPVCKILHIPSTTQMVQRVAAQPHLATKPEECLLFVIYYFAVFSMDEDECVRLFSEPKEFLVQRWEFAARQALVNANFLKSVDFTLLQAFVLYLMPGKFTYDPSVYWILTGAAIRLGQRIGLHRDGAQLGLLPFDVQMRRRLFFQLVPLDGGASQMSGTGIAMMPHTWDTVAPLNLNDHQIWPGMTDEPEEEKGPTDMIFCLVRASLGLFFARTGTMGHGGGINERQSASDMEPLIKDAEREVEEKYLRYLDPIEPLHFLTMGLARAGISAMRIRVRLPKVRNNTATVAEKKEILQLALKILDTDAAAYSNSGLRKFLWHAKAFFAWGSWDSLIFILSSLRSPGTFSPDEVNAAWTRIEQAYMNHGETLGLRKSMQTMTIARLTLKAWNASPPTMSSPEPAFITALRCMQNTRRRQGQQRGDSTSSSDAFTGSNPFDPSPPSSTDAPFEALPEGPTLDSTNDFDLDTADWVFWDKMIKDFQS